METISFNSVEDNIDDLELLFKSKPTKLTFVFIKNALRAGKRLCKDYMRGALDTVKTANAAATVQSLAGRLTGYDVNNKNFNIYCDIRYVEDCIRHWDATIREDKLMPIPSSRYSKTNVETTKSSCNISFYPSKDEAVKRANEIGIDTEAPGYGKDQAISRHIKNDISLLAIKRVNLSPNGHMYLVDRPSIDPNSPSISQEHEENWNLFIQEYGNDKIGKWILFEPCEEKTISHTINEPSATFVKNTRTLSELN